MKGVFVLVLDCRTMKQLDSFCYKCHNLSMEEQKQSTWPLHLLLRKVSKDYIHIT